MYEEFYGFSEPPFSLTPDPKFFYNGESHIRAFELLRYAIHRGEGFMVVYGDIGTGKTTLCRAVLENLQGDVYTALLLNPFLSETDLLRAILQDFGVISAGSPAAKKALNKHDLISNLNTFLLSILRLDAHAMVLIDEAQNIPIATLEQIRILTNLETTKHKLLQIVLVGQTELKDVLARPELRQLNQRISIRCELLPLSREETAEYIRHRISVASGGRSRVRFAADALKTIHDYSGGIPRLINLIGDRCLILGLATQAATIDRKIAREAVDNLELRKVKARPRPSAPGQDKLPRAARVAIVIGIAALISGFLVWSVNSGVFERWFSTTVR